MTQDLASTFRPVAEPRIIENAYSEDQHQRLLDVVRRKGPWKLILAQHFKSAHEVAATLAGSLPEGVEPTFDMFLSPVFRGNYAYNGVCLHPEIEDCFHNPKFLNLVRSYWNAEYAVPDSMLFNIQGPCQGGGAPHVDGTRFRGVTMANTPIWLMNTMNASGMFKRWQAKKAQVIAWYYQGSIGGGFIYWPQGPKNDPKVLEAPMWGRAVVVENEMMFHTAQTNGPSSMRKPKGLAFESLMSADPNVADGWQITTNDQVVQTIPSKEFRFLVHWGANVYMDFNELKVAMDHTDDLTHDQIFDTFIKDLRARGHSFDVPSDPLTDTTFIRLLNSVYDVGLPTRFPPEPVEVLAAE